MKMKKFLLAGMLTLVGSSYATSALADPNPNWKHLYHAPLQIQLVNGAPTVSDYRQVQPQPSYVIEVPNLPSSAQAPPQMIRPSNNAPIIVNSNGSPISVLGPNGLPNASAPLSNMGSLRSPGGLLPNATSTNRLAGRMIHPQQSQPQKATQHPAIAAVASAPVVATYKPQTVSSSQSNFVTTSTNANLIPRGTLLH